jgi:hypothetical protein
MVEERPVQKRVVRLYQDKDVVVTTAHFVTAEGHRYRVADLVCLVEAKGAPHSGIVVSLATAATTAIGVIAAAAVAHSSTPLAIGGMAVVVPAGAALFCAYRWPPCNSLRARYHGTDVELYRSRDPVILGKIGRALIRAREMSGEVATR